MKAELHLSDTELGVMGGLSFALFYTALGLPIALLAERWSRTWIMTIALTLWSACTAACGLVGNFSQLFLARMGVGVGEAGGGPPPPSPASDHFPQEAPARAPPPPPLRTPLRRAPGGGVRGRPPPAANRRAAPPPFR
ncbi:MFS transporter, partial [Clostridioides difficile]|uniref:MFS transporter n=1 Tax=Clostridioides difficile TaxID=1496 RepID=UPI0034DD95A6